MAAPGPSCSALLGPAAKAPPLAEPGPFPGTRSRRCGFQTCDGALGAPGLCAAVYLRGVIPLLSPLPLPPAPQTRCFFARCFANEERGMRRHSIASAMLGLEVPLVLDGAQSLAPCSWQPFGCLAGRRILISRARAPSPALGKPLPELCCQVCPLLTLPFLHTLFML